MITIMTPQIFNLIREMKEVDVFEDRREYDVDDLKSTYQLPDCVAHPLYTLIQQEFDCNVSVFDYFTSRFAERGLDPAFKQFDISSNCGADCKKVIDAALPLYMLLDPHVRPQVMEGVIHQLNILYFG